MPALGRRCFRFHNFSVRARAVLLAAAVVACTGPASQAVVIDFDDLPGGLAPPPVLPANASPHATFSTAAGAELYVFSGAGVVGGSAPNSLTAAVDVTSGEFNADIYVDFVSPVAALMMKVLADNDSGSIATINVYESGVFSAAVDVVGNGNFSDPIIVDMSAYSAVTRVELVGINDEFGLSIDDLSFDEQSPAPEPSAVALLLTSVLSAGARRRR